VKPKLTNDQDKAYWLQCLQATSDAALKELVIGTRSDTDPETMRIQLARLRSEDADRLFEEFRKRCES
jgi:hypothetical protein